MKLVLVVVSGSVVPESEHPQTTRKSASVAVVVTESMTPVARSRREYRENSDTMINTKVYF